MACRVARPRPAAGQLEGALVGLGARVAEEHPAADWLAVADEAVEGGGDLGTDGGAVQVRDVQQRAGLVTHGLCNGRVGMAEGGDGEAAEEVEVGPPVAVVEAAALATHERDRRLRIGRHQVLHQGATIVPMPSVVKISSRRA